MELFNMLHNSHSIDGVLGRMLDHEKVILYESSKMMQSFKEIKLPKLKLQDLKMFVLSTLSEPWNELTNRVEWYVSKGWIIDSLIIQRVIESGVNGLLSIVHSSKSFKIYSDICCTSEFNHYCSCAPNIEILKEMHGLNYEFKYALPRLFIKEEEEMIDYILSERIANIEEHTLSCIAIQGNLNAFKMIHKKMLEYPNDICLYNDSIAERLYTNVVHSRNIDILKYVFEELNVPPKKSAIECAIGSNDIKMVEYLMQKDFPYNHDIWFPLLEQDNFEMFKLVFELGYDLTKSVKRVFKGCVDDRIVEYINNIEDLEVYKIRENAWWITNDKTITHNN